MENKIEEGQQLGHQVPKGLRQTKFSEIHIDGDLHYCRSHNFVYDSEKEEEKLYNAQPCYHTDGRFRDGNYNFYKDCKLFWKRFGQISLKACIRRTLNCKNIPIGTIVTFDTSWYYTRIKKRPCYLFKIRKENKLDINYEINLPSFSQNFNTCEFSKKLTDALRENGFIVTVNNHNPDFIMGMIKNAAAMTGQTTDDIDGDVEGEIATAYGYGKKIGFSSGQSSYRGYYNGQDNILWDWYGEFNKWSKCCEIPKTASIEEIIKILKSEKKEEDK